MMSVCLLYTSYVGFQSGDVEYGVHTRAPSLASARTRAMRAGRGMLPVSYTHLDVYKRQTYANAEQVASAVGVSEVHGTKIVKLG